MNFSDLDVSMSRWELQVEHGLVLSKSFLSARHNQVARALTIYDWLVFSPRADNMISLHDLTAGRLCSVRWVEDRIRHWATSRAARPPRRSRPWSGPSRPGRSAGSRSSPRRGGSAATR